MKSLTLRSSVALACALSLAACGGGGGNLQLSGAAYGVTMAGLVLINNNNGDKVEIAAGQSSFYFTKLLTSDESFNVTVVTPPGNADCTVNNGKGKTGSYSVNTVEVVCIVKTHALGGKINGLNTSGLVLVNGADKVTVAAGAQSFDFAKIGEGAPYGVTILSQPATPTCRITNGVGIMGKDDIKNIMVACD